MGPRPRPGAVPMIATRRTDGARCRQAGFVLVVGDDLESYSGRRRRSAWPIFVSWVWQSWTSTRLPREGTAIRFERHSALDLLADALRRADATWHGDALREWDELAEVQQEQWRALARVAATTVYEEISEARQCTSTR